ncbi:MAG: ATP-binding protein [Salinivenus sp.]
MRSTMNGTSLHLPVSATVLLETVLAEAPLLVMLLDDQGHMQYVNPAVEKLTGYADHTLVDTSVCDRFIPEDEQEEVRAGWVQLWTDGNILHTRHHWRTKGRGRRHLNWKATRVRGKTEEEYVLAMGTDSTAQQQLEEDVLTVSEEERRRIGQELHDGLAADLTAAAMSLELLQRGLRQGKARPSNEVHGRLASILGSVRDGAKQARSLSHLLAAPSIEPGNVSEALGDLVRKHEEISGTACRLHLPVQEVPTMPDASVSSHLYHIAQEAIRNAIKHANADCIDVRLAVQPQGQEERTDEDTSAFDDGTKVVLQIQDDGDGLPEDVHAAVVDAWGCEGMPRSCDSGLGLHLMQYRADLMGATLVIDSSPGDGTTVTCKLPLRAKGEVS